MNCRLEQGENSLARTVQHRSINRRNGPDLAFRILSVYITPATWDSEHSQIRSLPALSYFHPPSLFFIPIHAGLHFAFHRANITSESTDDISIHSRPFYGDLFFSVMVVSTYYLCPARLKAT